MKPKGIMFGRMYPNAGYQAKYRRELRRMIKVMHEDTKRELRAFYSEKTQDGVLRDISSVFKKLRKKWYKIFEKRAREMEEWLEERVDKRTKKDVANQLKVLGLALTPNYSESQKEVIRKATEEAVNLIKTIPRDYLNDVHNVVRDAVERGGDRAAIKEAIEDKFDHPLVKTEKQAERRAELIAKDQVQKVTQEYSRENAKAYGATKARWIHIAGEKTSRITHIHMDGQEFDIDKGLYDEDVGEYVLPGQLIYCMCSAEYLFPGTE